mmetsp:Transcript_31348/g.102676  ORF Transcript_31348/g.102676 Transcript_31348/m.102676 type:complete len:397 (+) Transcript_31348:660-1850(+)
MRGSVLRAAVGRPLPVPRARAEPRLQHASPRSQAAAPPAAGVRAQVRRLAAPVLFAAGRLLLPLRRLRADPRDGILPLVRPCRLLLLPLLHLRGARRVLPGVARHRDQPAALHCLLARRRDGGAGLVGGGARLRRPPLCGRVTPVRPPHPQSARRGLAREGEGPHRRVEARQQDGAAPDGAARQRAARLRRHACRRRRPPPARRRRRETRPRGAALPRDVHHSGAHRRQPALRRGGGRPARPRVQDVPRVLPRHGRAALRHAAPRVSHRRAPRHPPPRLHLRQHARDLRHRCRGRPILRQGLLWQPHLRKHARPDVAQAAHHGLVLAASRRVVRVARHASQRVAGGGGGGGGGGAGPIQSRVRQLVRERDHDDVYPTVSASSISPDAIRLVVPVPV